MIAAVFALEFESAGFRAAMQSRMCVSVWTLGVMGGRAAQALEKLVHKNRPALVISAGFSGALQPNIPIGTLVLGENFTDSDVARHLILPAGFLVGRIVTADEIVESAAQKMALGLESGALAVDLESAHLHAVCSKLGIPIVSIRCITDAMEQDIPLPRHLLMDPESSRPDPGSIFRYLFRHPAKVPEFASLVRNARAAQAALANGLNDILPALLRPLR